MVPLNSKSLSNRFADAALRGVTWALIGALYGFLFVASQVFVGDRLPLLPALFVATVMTSTLAALIYSSMRLTIILSIFTNLIVMAWFVLTSSAPNLMSIAQVGLAGGAVGGAIYGSAVKSSRIFCADAKIIAGVIAGVIASIGVLTPAILFEPLPAPVAVALLAPATGALYVLVTPYMIDHCAHLLSPALDGAVVGAGLGGAVAVLSWFLAGIADAHAVGVAYEQVTQLANNWPRAAIAGALTSSVLGMARAFIGSKWYDS